MAEIKWIKIATSIFDDEKIKHIETLKNSEIIINIWFKLLILCGKCNRNGYIKLSESIPYTVEMLAKNFNKDVRKVRQTLDILMQLEMIEKIDDTYYITNWEKHQNTNKMSEIREKTRKRVAKYRQNKTVTNDENVTQCNANVTQNVTLDVTQCNALDKEIDIEEEYKEKEKDKKEKETHPQKHKHGDYQNVLLSDEEYDKLHKEFNNASELITFLDEYIEMKGYKAKSHYLAIRKWVVDAVKERKRKGNKTPIEEITSNPFAQIRMERQGISNEH